jgi:hypothetical protein
VYFRVVKMFERQMTSWPRPRGTFARLVLASVFPLVRPYVANLSEEEPTLAEGGNMPRCQLACAREFGSVTAWL